MKARPSSCHSLATRVITTVALTAITLTATLIALDAAGVL